MFHWLNSYVIICITWTTDLKSMAEGRGLAERVLFVCSHKAEMTTKVDFIIFASEKAYHIEN